MLYFHAQDAAQRGDSKALTTHLRKIAEQIDAQPEALLRYRPQMLLLTGLAHFGSASWTPPSAPSRSTRQPWRLGRGHATWPSSTSSRSKRTPAFAALEGICAPAHRRQGPRLLGQAKLSAGQPQQAATLMREALAGQGPP